jgi:hypothetical protein
LKNRGYQTGMMRSKKSLRLLDLDRGLSTNAADILALRESRRDKLRDLKAYLEFLSNFPEPSTPELSAPKGPAGDKPFEL